MNWLGSEAILWNDLNPLAPRMRRKFRFWDGKNRAFLSKTFSFLACLVCLNINSNRSYSLKIMTFLAQHPYSLCSKTFPLRLNALSSLNLHSEEIKNTIYLEYPETYSHLVNLIAIEFNQFNLLHLIISESRFLIIGSVPKHLPFHVIFLS